MTFTKEDLKKSEQIVGQIYPVLVDKNGKIVDGFHRKSVNPNWKEEKLETDDPMQLLKIRVISNFRRDVPAVEKTQWVKDCRKLLQEKDMEGTQKQVSEALGLSVQWVSKYDEEPIQPHAPKSIHGVDTFPSSNVWGLEDGE